MAKKFTFQSVIVDRQQPLGSGRYGTTYQAYCDHLLCAGKVMSPGLFESSEQGGGGGRGGGGKLKKSLVTSFQQEVASLRGLSHPHLVLYLGTSIDINSQLPLLLMELCSENLTSFLNKLQESLPYNKELKLLQGIVLALAFLHAHGIIHCNLSSNNILVMPGPTAKVSDYGMTKVVSSTKHSSLQHCGDPAYLPPEALTQPPRLTPKTDCFSWGVLAMQTLTQQPPLPPLTTQSPSSSRREQGQALEAVASSEEQHKVALMLIDSAHPLLQIIKSVLRPMEGHRPPMEVVSQSLAQLKKEREFHESVQKERETPSELSELENELGEMKSRLRQKDKEIARLKEELEEMKAQDGLSVYLQKQVQHKEKTIERLTQQISEMKGRGRSGGGVGVEGGDRDRGGGVTGGMNRGGGNRGDMEEERGGVIEAGGRGGGREGERGEGGGGGGERSERTVERGEKTKEKRTQPEQEEEEVDTPRSLSWRFQSRTPKWLPSQRRSTSPSIMTPSTATCSSTTDFKLAVKVGKAAPAAMARGGSVVHGTRAYFAPMGTTDRKIYVSQLHVYSRNVSWTYLPECPCYDFGLASVNGLLTAVGGYEHEFQMSEPTNSLLSLSEANSNGKWEKKLQPMPTKRRLPAVVSVEHLLIVAGGQGTRNEILSTVEVMNTSTSQWSTAQPLPIPLMHASIAVHENNIYIAGGKTNEGPTQAAYCSQLQNPSSLKRGPQAPELSPWQQILNTPTQWCTLVSQGGHLLALGGQDNQKSCSQTIYTYIPSYNLWATAGNMRHKRSATLAAVLSDETLVVVGGFTKKNEVTNAAEIIILVPQ